MTIDEAIDKSCKRCDLHKTRGRIVVGKGSEHANIMLIGEAPGQNEDVQGIPFCGRAGATLDDLLSDVGLSIDDIYVTNVVCCRPPNNRDPFPDEIRACRKWLARKIKIVKPRLLIILGRVALRMFTPNGHAERGRIFDWLGYKVLYLYHPAALLYNPSLRPTMIEHLSRNIDFIRSVK